MESNSTMTNNKDTPMPAASTPSGLGNRLKTAREQLHLSEKEAAARLHLNPRIILIMENEQFDNDLPATFMHGYLRSYARLLNISENEINSAILQIIPAAPKVSQPNGTPPILKTWPIPKSYRYLRALTYIIIAALIVLVGLWWSSHPKDFITTFKSAVQKTNLAVAPVVQPTIPVPTPVAAPSASLTLPPASANVLSSSPAPLVTPAPQSTDVSNDAGMALSDPALEQNDNNLY